MTGIDKTLLVNIFSEYLKFRRRCEFLSRSKEFLTTCQACPKLCIQSVV